MLEHTFCHIPGIGLKSEVKLWNAGVTTWSKWREPLPVKFSVSTMMDAQKILEDSAAAVEAKNPLYFTDKLSSSDPWRIFPEFRDETAYLDIETTGLDDFAEVTTIALYDGKEVYSYVNGQNLEDFVEHFNQFKLVVSYNGKSFDVPFLERYFRTTFDHAHIDLRYVLARLGFKGGLKGCEKQLGLNRGNLDGVDGYFAVLLWRKYKSTFDDKALETLLAYNIEDTVNLERLMVEAYNRNVATTPFAHDLQLAFPAPPPNPYFADFDTVEQLKREIRYSS